MNYLPSNIKNIIFDMDGTLIDSMDVWDDVGERFLIENNRVAEENLLKKLEEMTFDESAKYLIDNYNLDYSVEYVKNRFNEIVKYKYENTINLKEGVKDFLENLFNRGINLCVCTVTNIELAKNVLKRLNILKYFQFILTTEEENLTKRDYKIYLKACKKLGSKVENTAVFEDSLHCIKSAKRGGFFVVGVYDSSSIKNIEEIKEISNIYLESYRSIYF